MTIGMLSAPLENAFNNGSRGICSPLSTTWVSLVVLGGLLSSPAHVMNNSHLALCYKSRFHIGDTSLYVDGLPFILGPVQVVPISGLQDW